MRRGAQDRRAIGLRQVLEKLGAGISPSGMTAGHVDHGPIGAPHQTVGSETLDKVIDVGFEGGDGPVAVGLGDQTGDLAPGIGIGGDVPAR